MLGCCCSGSRPADLGVRQNGQLRPAPGSPNCVCSDAPRSDSLHFIEPLVVTVSPDVAWQRAASTLSSWEGAVIADRNDQYMHVEVSSKVRGLPSRGLRRPAATHAATSAQGGVLRSLLRLAARCCPAMMPDGLMHTPTAASSGASSTTLSCIFAPPVTMDRHAAASLPCALRAVWGPPISV